MARSGINEPVTQWWTILKKAARRLGKNNPIHLAGATAFLATFSLAPIFVLIIHVLGSVVGKKEIKQNIVRKFAEDAPEESVAQFRQFLEGFQQLWGAWYVNIALTVFLLFSAARLFILIRGSFYQLWRLKHIKEASMGLKIRKWLFPIVLIISAGVLLMAGVLGQGLRAFLGDAVAEVLPAASGYFNSIYRYAVSLVIAWLWFALVFRYLTDARPQWKTVLVGALLTSVLYNIGKAILQPSLSMGKIHAIFGTSASLVMLQLFIFYISVLIYYGAAFTLEWARHHRQTVHIPDYLCYYTIEKSTPRATLFQNSFFGAKRFLSAHEAKVTTRLRVGLALLPPVFLLPSSPRFRRNAQTALPHVLPAAAKFVRSLLWHRCPLVGFAIHFRHPVS